MQWHLLRKIFFSLRHGGQWIVHMLTKPSIAKVGFAIGKMHFVMNQCLLGTKHVLYFAQSLSIVCSRITIFSFMNI